MDVIKLDNANIVETITNVINTIFNNLFSSIDNSAYATLDDITFISTDIIKESAMEKLLGSNSSTGIIIIANAVLVGLAIYYAIRYMSSIYTNTQIERPYQFIFTFNNHCLYCQFCLRFKTHSELCLIVKRSIKTAIIQIYFHHCLQVSILIYILSFRSKKINRNQKTYLKSSQTQTAPAVK